MAGGITYTVAAPILAQVVENGLPTADPRVMVRTNEAIKAILDEILPVGGALTADVVASGTTLLLPKELENAIYVEVLGGASVNGQTDVTVGFYNIVNQFAYADLSQAHDNPLVDQFLQPDPNDATILRRQYDYPGLAPNSTVRVTGAKRYIPITAGSDYLIVQNILAIKDMIQSIEKGDRGDMQGKQAFHDSCLGRLTAEIKKHQLDPQNSMKRKGAYEADLVTYPQYTFGWTRARLAFELPGAMAMGKSELTRLLEQSEMRMMDKGQWIGTLQEYDASVTAGLILCPKEVEAILAIALCGHPLNIKNLFFKYQQKGHRWWGNICPCDPELRDEGQTLDSDNNWRKQYRLIGASASTAATIRFVGALRWVKKLPTDMMAIRNFEATRLMCKSMLAGDDPNFEAMAFAELDGELNKYLSGQMVTAPVDLGFAGHHHGML